MPDSNEQKTPTIAIKKSTLKRDLIFISIVITLITVLVLGSNERRTSKTPEDEIHISTTSSTQCMECHNADGINPQPVGHLKAKQCFQCHQQPKDWQGAQ
ncbi:MAG: hypothetical protein R8L53_07625 [Mariprofundales bacterium]